MGPLRATAAGTEWRRRCVKGERWPRREQPRQRPEGSAPGPATTNHQSAMCGQRAFEGLKYRRVGGGPVPAAAESLAELRLRAPTERPARSRPPIPAGMAVLRAPVSSEPRRRPDLRLRWVFGEPQAWCLRPAKPRPSSAPSEPQETPELRRTPSHAERKRWRRAKRLAGSPAIVERRIQRPIGSLAG